MHYATHCVSPCLALIGAGTPSTSSATARAASDETLIPKYGSPFAIETATFKLRDSDVCAEVTRSLFDTARQYRESFDVYGSKKIFEWQQVENEDPVIHTKSTRERPLTKPEIPKRVKVPDYAHLLPEPIRAFTQPCRDSGRRTSLVPAGRRPRRLAPAPGPRLPDGLHRRRGRRCPMPRRRPTGRWSASARTSRR